MDRVIEMIGIVDGVKAERKGGEVKFLNASIRFESEFDSIYGYGDAEKKIDDINISFNPLSGINPGDLVELQLRVTNPRGQRFAPALEASEVSDA